MFALFYATALLIFGIELFAGAICIRRKGDNDWRFSLSFGVVFIMLAIVLFIVSNSTAMPA